ncbi:hypothetical protein ACKWTF_014391 [Chironomus riparius]
MLEFEHFMDSNLKILQNSRKLSRIFQHFDDFATNFEDPGGTSYEKNPNITSKKNKKKILHATSPNISHPINSITNNQAEIKIKSFKQDKKKNRTRKGAAKKVKQIKLRKASEMINETAQK